jgi:hypothetical protein
MFRPRRKGALAAVGASAAALLAVSLTPAAGTFAAFSDFGTVSGNKATAAVWQPNPPEQCGDLSQYSNGIVYNDVPGARIDARIRTIIIATGGNATVTATAHTCIVLPVGGNTILTLDATTVVVLGTGQNWCAHGNDAKQAILCSLWSTKPVISYLGSGPLTRILMPRNLAPQNPGSGTIAPAGVTSTPTPGPAPTGAASPAVVDPSPTVTDSSTPAAPDPASPSADASPSTEAPATPTPSPTAEATP